jgi:hypothetical protein
MPDAYADPTGLADGGRALWDACIENVHTPEMKAILLEACRCKDRLDAFDRILSGDVEYWTHIKENRDGKPDDLVIDKAASLAVSTQNMMKQLLAVLRLPDAKGNATGRQQRASTGAYTGAGVGKVTNIKDRARAARSS